MRDHRDESSGKQPSDSDEDDEGERRPKPFESLPAWWGQAVSDIDRHQLDAADLDLDKYAFEFGHDDETLLAFAKTPNPCRFLVCDELSVTRFAAVYTAIDCYVDRPVVLKISLRTIEPEGRQIAMVRHPNVVTILDVLVCATYPTIVLEWCAQESLHDYGAASQDWSLVLARGIEAGRALVYCHELGIVHGDVKPSNILITDDVAKLADFGISRAETSKGEPVGTPGFAPPERARGEWALPGDVFSYAVTIQVALSRFDDFDAPTRLPHRLITTLAAARVKNPKQRPTMAKLVTDLEQVLADESTRRVQGEHERERQALARRRRWGFQLQVATVVATSIIVTSTVVLAGVCSLPSTVEMREPSIDRAIELAEAGDPLGAWLEYHQLNQDKDHVLPSEELNRLAESLLNSTSQLEMDDVTAAATLAEIVAIRAHLVAKQGMECEPGVTLCGQDAAVQLETAARLRDTARAINRHN